jgi:iron complex transport system ATP-binding protein
MSDTKPLLQVIDLTLTVGDKTLVRDLNWSVEPGQRWCIIGKNGAGKSTLLKLIGGIQEPINLHGIIQWHGQDLATIEPPGFAKLRSYTEQFAQGAFGMRAIDLLNAIDSRDAQATERYLDLFDLKHLHQAWWRHLSGGEKQRFALAAALIQDAPCWLMDEPLAHLDLHYQVNVLQALKQLSIEQNKTWIAAIHEVSLVSRAFTHALILMPDQTYLAGALSDIFKPAHLEAALGQKMLEALLPDGSVYLVPA